MRFTIYHSGFIFFNIVVKKSTKTFNISIRTWVFDTEGFEGLKVTKMRLNVKNDDEMVMSLVIINIYVCDSY